MITASCKAKARRLQNFVAERFRVIFTLDVDECRPALMGEMGTDIKIPARAWSKCRYAAECKNVERIELWKAWKQAKHNAEPVQSPLLVITKNHSDTLVVMSFEEFERLIEESNNNQVGW